MDSTTRKLHYLLVVGVYRDGRLGDDLRNLCTAMRDNVLALGDALVVPATTTTTCQACQRKLEALGRSLDTFARAHRSAAQEAAELQAFQARRVPYLQQQFVQDIQAVALRLRREADDIDRRLAQYQAAPTTRTYQGGPALSLTADVQHSVLWTVPNLNLDALLRRAIELDTALVDGGLLQKEVR